MRSRRRFASALSRRTRLRGFRIKLADGLLLDVPAKEPRDEIGRPKRRAPQGAKLIEAERPHAVNLSLDSLAIKC
jgi:hypothetical protein